MEVPGDSAEVHGPSADPDLVSYAEERTLRHARHRAGIEAIDTVILVEGLSDALAIDAVARALGKDLKAQRSAVVVMGGITNLGRCLEAMSDLEVEVRGLCDRGESDFVASHLHRRGLTDTADPSRLGQSGFFVCDRDLEDELIRALGVAAVERVIEAEGELNSLRRLQQMPFHRGGDAREQIHRFMGSRGGRKHRYATLLVEAMDTEQLPEPLCAVVNGTEDRPYA